MYIYVYIYIYTYTIRPASLARHLNANRPTNLPTQRRITRIFECIHL